LSVRFDRYCGPLPCLLSFLTRRSSDLAPPNPQRRTGVGMGRAHGKVPAVVLFADFAEAGKDVHELHGRSLLVALVCLEGSRSPRSEEHTSELQSRENLVCRLLLEKKQN